MIATLRGKVLFVEADQAVIEAGGVGYRVRMSASGLASLREGEEAFVHVFTAVREDAIELFAFSDPDEKRMFMLLNSVSGVGPKLALAVLSGASCLDLHRAMSSGDAAFLTRIPGIGKKTAERLCLELKDRLDFIPQGQAPAPAAAAPASPAFDDAVSALVNLGYPQAAARAAVEAVRGEAGEEDFAAMGVEEMIRRALRSMA